MLAQSCASVPPAPAAISSCTSRASSGPLSSDLSRKLSSSDAMATTSRSRSRVISSSGSASSISASSFALRRRCSRSPYDSTTTFSAFMCCTTDRACSWLFQKPASAICASRRLSVSRLAGMSKVPPQLRKLFLVLPQCARALAVRHLLYPAPVALEHLLAVRQNVVQGIREMRRRFRELASDLIDELLIALPDLLAEEILQRSVSQPLLLLLRKVGDEVRDQRAREASRLRVRVVRQERVDRSRSADRPAQCRSRRRSRRTGGRSGRGVHG